MPPAYVKAYVKRNKNDAADAEAICEAVTRPTMRFVPIKSAEAQSVLMLHRARHLLVRQRRAQVSAMRGHLAEYGIVAAKGISRLRDLLPVLDAGAGIPPELARQTLLLIAQLIEALTMQIRKIETELLRWHRTNAASQRLETIPGVGFITATALAATVRDARAFRSGRQFAAWLGLVPRQNCGGKERLGGISKMGDRYLRHLLVVGATAVVYAAQDNRHKSLGKPAARTQACPAGYRRRRQQDGPDRLGRHGEGGELSRNRQSREVSHDH
jgi:transposase